jgi:hypothetical protein
MCIGGPNVGKTEFINRFFQPVTDTNEVWTSRHSADMVEESPSIVIESSDHSVVTVRWTKIRWNNRGISPECAMEHALRRVHDMDVAFVFVSDMHDPAFECDMVDKLRMCGTIAMLVLCKCDTYTDAAVDTFVMNLPPSPFASAFSMSHVKRAFDALYNDSESSDDDDIMHMILTKRLILGSSVATSDYGTLFLCMMFHIGLHSVVKARPLTRCPSSVFGSSCKSNQLEPLHDASILVDQSQLLEYDRCIWEVFVSSAFKLANFGNTWKNE